MSFIRHIKAAIAYATRFPWVEEADWTADDARLFNAFLQTQSGAKMKALCLKVVINQQGAALMADHGKLVFEAGYSAGQKGFVAFMESLADTTKFSELGEQDTDPATIQPES